PSSHERQASQRLFAFCMVVIFAACLTASLVQSSGGHVDIRSLTIPTQNGQWLAADLFKPISATKTNQAPLVVVIPGFQRSKEALSNISIELARRGIVVISIDPYAQGNSSSSLSRRAATTQGYGMFAVVDYAYETDILNYVDKQRIAATGHSAGGNAAIRGAAYFGKQAGKSGRLGKLHSVFVSGYALTMTDKVLRDVRSNVGMSYAFHDEGAYRNELKHGDMRKAPESLRLVNSGLATDEIVEEIEIGSYYGSLSNRTLRVVHNERLLHPFQPYSPEATANQIEFFEKAFGLPTDLSSHEQVWYWKELATFIAMIAAFVALLPLGGLLMETPYFKPLAHEIPPALPRPQGSGRLVFWFVFALSATIACFTYIPLSELSHELFVDASNRRMTWFFPQRMNNAVMLWAVLNGLVGFIIFFTSYFLFGSRHGIRTKMWGARISVAEFGRTLLLAGILFGFFFLTLFMMYWIFHVDYRFVFLGARVFQADSLILLGMYAPIFFVFFLSNSLRVNGAMRFEGVPEWRGMLLAGIANTLGLILILIVQYSVFAFTGTVHWTDGWLYVNLLFGVVPMMFVLPYFNRFFFRLTGRIYLGPMTTCLIFIMILLTNTVCYLPL
ncbi:MAG: alpha/beta hydrolase family protein, partial [Verrucomicrobiia bacterium]